MDTGLSQGHPLSPLLCNIYLDLFDKKMERHVRPSQIRDLDFRFLRFVDDIWLMTRNKKALELYTSRALQVLDELGFKSRVQIQHVNEGIDVLGFTVRRWSICPSAKSLTRLHRRLIHLLCKHLEMNNEAGQDHDTNLHAGNTGTTHNLQKQYQHLKTGWSSYYGHDAYTQTMEQWPTLDFEEVRKSMKKKSDEFTPGELFSLLSTRRSPIDPAKSVDEMSYGELLILERHPDLLEQYKRDRKKILLSEMSSEESKEPSVGELVKELYGRKIG